MKVGQQVSVMKRDGAVKNFRVTKMYGFLGLKRIEIQEAFAGDLIAISGMDDIDVGETVCPIDNQEALPLLHVDEPTLQMKFLVNNSPFAGREGKWVTSRKIDERLQQQLQTDVSLRVDPTETPDAWMVSGRGELHLSILIENMRREGFELQVSKPEVIVKTIDGKRCEPVENVQIDIPEEYTGSVIESMGERKGEMLDMVNNGNGQVRMTFLVPARGLIGYSTDFLTLTRGYGIINHSFDSYKPMSSEKVGGRRNGVLVSMENGKVTAYSVMQLEDRGIMFVEAGTDIYAGMVVGENTRESDITINLTRIKHATNVRSATKDQTVTTKKPKIMTLEEALQYASDDEYCEVTPESIRLRKKILDKNEREKSQKKSK